MRFQLAMLLIIPLAMVAVTLLIGDRLNRYVNLIFGFGYALFGSFVGDAAYHLLEPIS